MSEIYLCETNKQRDIRQVQNDGVEDGCKLGDCERVFKVERRVKKGIKNASEIFWKKPIRYLLLVKQNLENLEVELKVKTHQVCFYFHII